MGECLIFCNFFVTNPASETYISIGLYINMFGGKGMFHTEGFIDKDTYGLRGRVYSLAAELEGQPWYLWCVVGRKAGKGDKGLLEVLEFWRKQTLLTKGCKGVAYVQRELNRLGSYLERSGQLNGVWGEIRLFMYYQGTFYRWGDDDGKYMEDNGLRAYLSPDFARRLEGDSLERLANNLELHLLKGYSMGQMDRGFFMVWEDTYAGSKG